MTQPSLGLRTARPGDYDAIAAVVDDWWGREVLPSLPRLFLDLFWSTSLVAEDYSGRLAAFLVGVLSPSDPDEAYVHFVGVSPGARGSGLGRRLYVRFEEVAAADGRRVVRALTSPVNTASVAFHRAIGFTVTGPVEGHNGPGTSYVLFERRLDDTPTAGRPADVGLDPSTGELSVPSSTGVRSGPARTRRAGPSCGHDT